MMRRQGTGGPVTRPACLAPITQQRVGTIKPPRVQSREVCTLRAAGERTRAWMSYTIFDWDVHSLSNGFALGGLRDAERAYEISTTGGARAASEELHNPVRAATPPG